MSYRLMYVCWGLAVALTGYNVIKDLVGPGRWTD